MSETRRVVAFINLGHAFDHMAMLIFPTAVLTMERAFGLDYGELLALSIGGFIAFGAFSLPAGWLGDRWSRRHMMAVFFIGIGTATLLTGFASEPWHLAVGLTAIGIFAAIYHPVGTALLVANSPQMGRAIGVNGVWGNMGVALAALISGALAEAFGWRAAFFVPGLAAIIAGVAYVVMVPRVLGVGRPPAKAQAAVPRAVMLRAFAVLAVVAVAGGITFNAATVSLPKLFAERLDLSSISAFGAGSVAALVFAFGAVAQLIMGRIIDGMPLRRAFIPLAALQAPCFLLAAYMGGWWVVLFAAGVMFALFGQVVINDAMVARYTTDKWRARAYAVRYVVTFGASAVAVPMISLLHGTGGGFTTVYAVLAAFGLCIFLGALAFPHRPEEVAPAGPAAAGASAGA